MELSPNIPHADIPDILEQARTHSRKIEHDQALAIYEAVFKERRYIDGLKTKDPPAYSAYRFDFATAQKTVAQREQDPNKRLNLHEEATKNYEKAKLPQVKEKFPLRYMDCCFELGNIFRERARNEKNPLKSQPLFQNAVNSYREVRDPNLTAAKEDSKYYRLFLASAYSQLKIDRNYDGYVTELESLLKNGIPPIRQTQVHFDIGNTFTERARTEEDQAKSRSLYVKAVTSYINALDSNSNASKDNPDLYAGVVLAVSQAQLKIDRNYPKYVEQLVKLGNLTGIPPLRKAQAHFDIGNSFVERGRDEQDPAKSRILYNSAVASYQGAWDPRLGMEKANPNFYADVMLATAGAMLHVERQYRPCVSVLEGLLKVKGLSPLRQARVHFDIGAAQYQGRLYRDKKIAQQMGQHFQKSLLPIFEQSDPKRYGQALAYMGLYQLHSGSPQAACDNLAKALTAKYSLQSANRSLFDRVEADILIAQERKTDDAFLRHGGILKLGYKVKVYENTENEDERIVCNASKRLGVQAKGGAYELRESKRESNHPNDSADTVVWHALVNGKYEELPFLSDEKNAAKRFCDKNGKETWAPTKEDLPVWTRIHRYDHDGHVIFRPLKLQRPLRESLYKARMRNVAKAPGLKSLPSIGTPMQLRMQDRALVDLESVGVFLKGSNEPGEYSLVTDNYAPITKGTVISWRHSPNKVYAGPDADFILGTVESVRPDNRRRVRDKDGWLTPLRAVHLISKNLGGKATVRRSPDTPAPEPPLRPPSNAASGSSERTSPPLVQGITHSPGAGTSPRQSQTR